MQSRLWKLLLENKTKKPTTKQQQQQNSLLSVGSEWSSFLKKKMVELAKCVTQMGINSSIRHRD